VTAAESINLLERFAAGRLRQPLRGELAVRMTSVLRRRRRRRGLVGTRRSAHSARRSTKQWVSTVA
jgi:hypothetical protein